MADIIIKNRGLNKRYWMGLCLLVFGLLIFFNINHLTNINDKWSMSTMFDNPEVVTKHKYLVVIGTEAKYGPRRKAIRQTYFDIADNLVPVEFDTIQYAFLVHGGQPNSDTPERRAFESEKMEYNDVYQLPNDLLYNKQTIIDWVESNGKFSFDYLIVQDIHSFMNLNQVIKDIENSDQIIHWVSSDSDEMILHRNQLLVETDDYKEWKHQVWQNSVESTNDANILVRQVYQDEDFMDLVKLYQLQPVISMKSQRAKQIAVVTSSYIYDKCMEPSGTKASLNKRHYAEKHDYAFVARSREFAQQAIRPDQRRAVWGKIDVIQKVLPKYEWLFWLDMDAVILNDNLAIEELFKALEAKHNLNNHIDFIVVRPGTDKMINAGVFLIKNTPWSFQFLSEIQAKVEWYKQGPSYEQGAMWDVMRQPEHAHKILYLDRENHIFNTFPQLYEEGDFVVHFAPDKCPNAATLKGLAAAEKLKQGQKVTKADLV